MTKHLNHVIIAFAVIIATLLITNTYKNRGRQNDLINVTGLGSKDFASDLVVWSGRFSQKRMDLKEAYAALDKDRATIKHYLAQKGMGEDAIVFSAVDIDRQMNTWYDDDGQRHDEFTGFKLSQKVTIESREVEKVEAISREITELINQGVEFYSNAPQYYYTKLAELKIEMIAAATEDARVRAEKIAENAGSSLGSLRYAKMGVFQIIAQNSNEDYSWGGSFNTTSKMKTATITMKLQFGVD